MPSVDAVQEFKVKTSTFSAEFGHAAGAVVNATIKSGSNDFHGTVFEFLRNNVLDANNFFTNAAGQPRAPFHQNQFGFALGGPVWIPKVYNGRNRTFFFADYQGTRQSCFSTSCSTNTSVSISDVPPAALRGGRFLERELLGSTIRQHGRLDRQDQSLRHRLRETSSLRVD